MDYENIYSQCSYLLEHDLRGTSYFKKERTDFHFSWISMKCKLDITTKTDFLLHTLTFVIDSKAVSVVMRRVNANYHIGEVSNYSIKLSIIILFEPHQVHIRLEKSRGNVGENMYLEINLIFEEEKHLTVLYSLPDNKNENRF